MKNFSESSFGEDVTDKGINVKKNPPESGFINEPEVYDDFAYSGTGKVAEPDVVFVDDEKGISVFAPGAFSTEVGKTVPLKLEDGRVVGEATITSEDGNIEFRITKDDNDTSS